MMKKLPWLLLLLNLLVAAFFLSREEFAHTPAAAYQPLNIGQIALETAPPADPSPLPQALPPEPLRADSPPTDPAQPAASAADAAPPAGAPATDAETLAPRVQCRRWEAVSASLRQPARAALDALSAEGEGFQLNEHALETRRWIVFPPLSSRAAMNLKLQEFAALGIEDTLAITRGRWQYGISLGLYSSAASTRKRLEELEAHGISGVRVETRIKPGSEVAFDFETADPQRLARAEALAGRYAGTRLRVIDCPIEMR